MSQEKVKDIPAFLKARVTPENIRTNFDLFSADYKKKYIDTGTQLCFLTARSLRSTQRRSRRVLVTAPVARSVPIPPSRRPPASKS